MTDDGSQQERAPSTLRIRFGQGERPHLFWVGWQPRDKRLIKILSKCRASRELEILVLEEAGRARRVLAHHAMPADAPSGWIEHWVSRIESELEIRLRCYDLRHIETAEQWHVVARALGWLRP